MKKDLLKKMFHIQQLVLTTMASTPSSYGSSTFIHWRTVAYHWAKAVQIGEIDEEDIQVPVRDLQEL